MIAVRRRKARKTGAIYALSAASRLCQRAGTAAPTSLDPTLAHELFSHGAVVLLSGHQQREWTASPINPGVSFAGQSASAGSKRFAFLRAFLTQPYTGEHVQ